MRIAQVTASGGPTALLPVKLSNPQLEALSADGASLLALEVNSQLSPYALWKIPLPAGEPRRVLDLDAQDAAYFPDSRILFARGTDPYITENDGSSPRKFFGLDKSFFRVGQPTISPDGTRIPFSRGRRHSFSPRPSCRSRQMARTCEPSPKPLRREWSAVQTGAGTGTTWCTWFENRGTWDLWAQPTARNFLHRSTHNCLQWAGSLPAQAASPVYTKATCEPSNTGRSRQEQGLSTQAGAGQAPKNPLIENQRSPE